MLREIFTTVHFLDVESSIGMNSFSFIIRSTTAPTTISTGSTTATTIVCGVRFYQANNDGRRGGMVGQHNWYIPINGTIGFDVFVVLVRVGQRPHCAGGPSFFVLGRCL